MKRLIAILTASIMGLILSSTGFSMENSVNIHGFIGQGFIKTTDNDIIADSTDGTFQFNEMGINFMNEPLDKLRIGMQFFARDFGDVGNDEIILDWAYADYRIFDMLGIRGGKIKNPVGLYSETRDLDMLRTAVTLPWTTYDENLRDTANSVQGIGIYGDLNTERLGSASYQILIGTNNIKPDGPTARYLELGIFTITEIGMDTIYNYALTYTDPTGMLKLSQTAYFSTITADGQSPLGGDIHYELKNIEIYMSSLEFTWNNLVIALERYWSDSILELTGMGSNDVHILSYYGLLSYRLNSMFEVSYSYGEYYPDRYDRHGRKPNPLIKYNRQAWHKESVFALRCDLNSNWIFKIDYSYIDGDALLPRSVANTESPKRYWDMVRVKLSYNF